MLTKQITIQVPDEEMKQTTTFFIRKANEYQSLLSVTRGDVRANAKSLLGLLSMGLRQGDQVIISAEGPDEEAGLAELVKILAP